MRIVGRGAFGKVRIVEHRESRQLYALKYINKEECIRIDAVRNIIRERAILEQLDHPFLCRLRFAFQDSEHMYMVTDLMLGGDLHYHICRQSFSEDVLKFWFAELSSAIKYLHYQRVVHRDIKPQNILLDDRGHVHVTDFNVATYLHSRRTLTSNSGTGYYMAPEIHKGGGYNEAVDWWSLGVTLYECVYRRRPFEGATNDELRASVQRGIVQYPTNGTPVSGECLSVIQGFLEMNPSKRLGQTQEGWVALVRHPFFRSVDWRRLESKTLTPPFQPSSEQNNFDPTYDLEELIMGESSATLQARKRANRPKVEDAAKRERDLQFIEEKFSPFDYTVFEKYEGFKDPVKMTVGDPPEWVKPAFEGAEQGDLLPVKRITTMSGTNWQDDEPREKGINDHTTAPVSPQELRVRTVLAEDAWRGPNKSRSTSNIASRVGNHKFDDVPWKRRSLGMLRAIQQQHLQDDVPNSAGSLSEEYAMSLQGVRKKQSTRSFRERRERDRKNIADTEADR
ncbi:kinase-like domain-containing protein [Syncephalastrum racemosum]|uniref:Kinase-like domain-containing protein n=1 Tax=Syncephalastrum racemosum TaxID=13706 RepID=A0A1X2H4N8_SYNRA|nr:kinase-like domain-containing protein [Syncephalastrum racemosum]